MKIYDISKEISEEMIVYKNREQKKIKRQIVANHLENHYHESRLDLDMHCGSHMDAPLHMIPEGKTIEQLDLKRFMGNCKVFDLTHIPEKIYRKDLENFTIEKGDRILLKTQNSFDSSYNPKFVYIEEDAAEYLVEKGVITVGIDAMSVERDKPTHPTHQILLGAEMGVLEDLQLKEVPEGEYQLLALPLRIKGAEGSPVRAVLLQKETLS